MSGNEKKTHRGLTLVEVILSVVLTYMIASFLIMGLVQSYKMLSSAKGITTETFQIVEAMEVEIQNTQMALAEKNDLGFEKKEFTLFKNDFETTVEGYRVAKEADHYNLRFFAFVPEKGIPKLPVPVITKLEIAFNNGTSDYVSYMNEDLQTQRATLSYYDEKNVYMSSTFQWYVSRKGYPAVNYSYDVYHEKLFPNFPSDYQIIAEDGNNRSLSEIKDEYKGCHLLLVARPVSTSGKMGSRFQSNPIYISALPDSLSSPLLSHFDTGMIDKTVTEEPVPISDWRDLQGNRWTAYNTQTPSLMFDQAGTVSVNGVLEDIFVQYLNFADTQKMTTNIRNNVEGLTVFAVARKNEGKIVNEIARVNGEITWSLDFEEDAPDGLWQVLSDTIIPYLEFGEDQFYIDTIEIGSDGSDVLEVIIYEGILDESEQAAVKRYLAEKYGF